MDNQWTTYINVFSYRFRETVLAISFFHIMADLIVFATQDQQKKNSLRNEPRITYTEIEILTYTTNYRVISLIL